MSTTVQARNETDVEVLGAGGGGAALMGCRSNGYFMTVRGVRSGTRLSGFGYGSSAYGNGSSLCWNAPGVGGRCFVSRNFYLFGGAPVFSATFSVLPFAVFYNLRAFRLEPFGTASNRSMNEPGVGFDGLPLPTPDFGACWTYNVASLD